MLKQTITFQDLDGNDVTEDFYFNLSTVELAEMGFNDEGLADRMMKIIEEENTAKIFEMFKLILTKAIGQRSEDGRRFIKNQDIVDDFFQSNAYESLFLEWIQDGNKAAQFINNIMPASLDDTVAKLNAQQNRPVTDVPLPEEPEWLTQGRTPTPKELEGATQAQLLEAFRRKSAAN